MKRVALLALGAWIVSSCGMVREGITRYGEIKEVEAAIAKLLSHRHVHAYLENTLDHLKIEVKNSPLRDLPSAERHTKALQIAQLAYRTHASRSTLRVIEVVFVIEQTESSGAVSSREYDALASHRFPVGDLAAPPSAAPATSAGRE